LEAALVAVTGAAFAFAANALSPRGLTLRGNYFPAHGQSSPPAPPATNSAAGTAVTNTNPLSARELLAARLKADGLQLVDGRQAEELFRDPRYGQELIVFVDARDDQRYQEGHVPGAYQFDHFQFIKHPEQCLATVLPACQSAQQVVVYCNGGDCEDSEFAAKDLRDALVPKERLFVYDGGIMEWTAKNLPIEIGSRKSGQLRNANK
jgi:3-mercaptopyruvate sulfurtransferase SseA